MPKPSLRWLHHSRVKIPFSILVSPISAILTKKPVAITFVVRVEPLRLRFDEKHKFELDAFPILEKLTMCRSSILCYEAIPSFFCECRLFGKWNEYPDRRHDSELVECARKHCLESHCTAEEVA